MTALIQDLSDNGYNLRFIAGLLLGMILTSAIVGGAIAWPFAFYRGHRAACHTRRQNHLL